MELKHTYKTQRTGLFSFYLFIFYLLFSNHFGCSCSPPSCTFPWHVNTGWVCSLLIVVSHSLYVMMLSTFCTWTVSLKRTPLPCQFSQWSLRFDSPELKLECLNCQKSDIRTKNPCCSVLLWTSFCFQQVNQQKCIGIVSANKVKVLWTALQIFSVETISHCVFD